MAHYKMLDGNGAAVEAIRMAKVKVVSAYPITPQSTIAEKLSELCDSGELDAYGHELRTGRSAYGNPVCYSHSLCGPGPDA